MCKRLVLGKEAKLIRLNNKPGVAVTGFTECMVQVVIRSNGMSSCVQTLPLTSFTSALIMYVCLFILVSVFWSLGVG